MLHLCSAADDALTPKSVAAADVLYQRGNALLQAGQVEAATAAYRAALEVAPTHAPAVCNLGLAAAAQGDWRSSALAYERAIDLQDDQLDLARSLSNLGVAQHELGNGTAALASYFSALTLRPTYVGAFTNLGQLMKARPWLQRTGRRCALRGLSRGGAGPQTRLA